MPIDLKCSCGAHLRAKDHHAGKLFKCPKCGAPIQVPRVQIPSPSDAIPDDPSTNPASAEPPPNQPEAAPEPTPAQPPTERQKEYARSLGIKFADDVDRATLSKRIGAAKQQQEDDRYKRLDELQNRESEAWEKMRQEVIEELDGEDLRLSKADVDDIAAALTDRETAAILITFSLDDFDAVLDSSGGKLRITHDPDLLTQEDVCNVLRFLVEGLMDEDAG